MPAERALILDFGGVVTRTLFETHDMTERALGLTGARIQKVVSLWPGRDQYIDHSEQFAASLAVNRLSRSWPGIRQCPKWQTSSA